MKQHPIPQNILDIEFKVFTKFTIREFAYMAMGIGFGGIFLYLFSTKAVSGFVAFPVFIFSSLFGLFLGLVPINEQKPDVFLRNFLAAITRPTQRVWRNNQFDQKLEVIAQQKGLRPTDQEGEQNQPKIIGGISVPSGTSNYLPPSTLKELDQDESEKISQFEDIEREIQGGASNTFVAPSGPQAQPAPPSTSSGAETDPTTAISNAKREKPEQVGVQPQNTSNQPAEVAPGAAQPGLKSIQPQEQSSSSIPSREKDVKVQKTEPKPQPVTPPSTNSNQSQVQHITQDTLEYFKEDIAGYQPSSNNIAVRLVDSSAQPVSEATIFVKNSAGSLVRVLQSDPNGIAISNKAFPNGSFGLEIKHDTQAFPTVNFTLNNTVMPGIKIKAL